MEYNTEILQSFSRLESVLNEYASEFERLFKQRLTEDNFKATGNLINSVEARVKIGSDYYSVVFDAKDYYKYVGGRKAGKWPPREAIARWIKAKKILPQPDKEGNLPTENQLAFLIQRAIGENGTVKRFNYEKIDLVAETVEALNEQYIPLMQEALQEDFEHIAIEAFDSVMDKLKVW